MKYLTVGKGENIMTIKVANLVLVSQTSLLISFSVGRA
jgi:hypothetical protein